MKKRVISVLLAVFLICIYANSQTYQTADSIFKYVKARYLKEDLTRYLSEKTKYPFDEMVNRVHGDVVYSFIINKSGGLENLAIKNFPVPSLLNSSGISMNLLKGEWKPALLNGIPIDRKYLIVFRFRTYVDSRPVDFKGQGKRFLVKQKYEKALNSFNSGIEDNKFDFALFELSSQVKKALGDIEGAQKDLAEAKILKDEIMAVIDVVAMGYFRTDRISKGIEIVPQF
jgi:hypothetical protein